ncbi:hypothetical protein RB595_000507 [Gaeumannomyces hyphopodioides]
MSIMGSQGPPAFTLKEAPVENLRPLKVRIIGAGFSGILAAIRIPEKLRNIDLAVYEKSDAIGGVWWLNKYPGIACDIPSHSYQYTFAPNKDWSNLYAPGKEIQEYLQGVAEKFGATRFIKTSHEVKECVWDGAKRKWIVEVVRLQTGETFKEEVDILISARGQLNDIAWPEIPGLDKFKGKLLHSGDWDTTYDFKNKKVGIIGNGSSAIQILPNIRRVEGVSVTMFARSKTWISPSFGIDAMAALGKPNGTTEFTEEMRALFAKDPEAWFKFRKEVEDGSNLIHDSQMTGTKMLQDFREGMMALMRERLAKKPELFERVVAGFSPGCRRLTPGPGFLEALTEDNVSLVSEAVARVTETGVVLASGAEHAGLDALVCATGFRTTSAPPFRVVGRGGVTLAQRWSPRPESYLSVAVDGFPNLLLQFGPNSAIGFGSLTKMLEAECDYVVKVLRKMQKEDYATVEPRAERVRDFTQFADEYFSRTVHLEDCRSWYRTDGGKGPVVALWPGSTLHALEALRSPRWEDFVFESNDTSGNMLRWLGNGWSTTETEGDPSWYINPEEVDWPMEGKPEDAQRLKNRPWSY